MGRISKENYYLDIAETVLERATCLRRVYGAIIVKNDEIISTGETASAVAKKLQINKAVQISDSSGNVEAKQVQLPVEGRLDWMQMLRKDIFHFGMGVDTDSDDWGKAASGVALFYESF